MSTTVNAHATAIADLHLHLSTGNIGGGIGQDVGLHGDATTSIPIQLRIMRSSTPLGSAIFLQPAIDCAPIKIDIRTDGDSLIDTTVLKVAYVGLRIRRNIGGSNQKPSLMIDSLPRIVPLLNSTNDNPKINLSLRHPRLRYSLKPENPLIDKNSIAIEAGFELGATDDSPDPNFDLKLAALREELGNSNASKPCPADQEISVLLGSHEIGQNNDLVKFAKLIVGTEVHIAEQTFEQTKRLFTNPGQTIEDTPGNVKREVNKGMDHLFGSGAPHF
jgi:hypothetical protein